jgi:hypothetical protein
MRWGTPFEDAEPPATTYDGPSARFGMTINGKYRESARVKVVVAQVTQPCTEYVSRPLQR